MKMLSVLHIAVILTLSPFFEVCSFRLATVEDETAFSTMSVDAHKFPAEITSGNEEQQIAFCQTFFDKGVIGEQIVSVFSLGLVQVVLIRLQEPTTFVVPCMNCISDSGPPFQTYKIVMAAEPGHVHKVAFSRAAQGYVIEKTVKLT